MTILVKIQEWMLERAHAVGAKIARVDVPGAGNCVNVSRPGIVVAELVKLTEL